LKIKRLCPAKINWYLNIVAKRSDGYHEIDTLMVPVKLYDRITVNKRNADKTGVLFSCNDLNLPIDENNTIIKTVKLMEEYTGRQFDLDIYLEKAIPYGAGLGGGSSNAEAVLSAIDELLSLKIELTKKHEILSMVGADAPFFLYQRAAICKGTGTEVYPIDFPTEQELVIIIIVPDIEVNTRWAYSLIEKNALTLSIGHAKNFVPGGIPSGGLSSVERYNFFEHLVFPHYPILSDVRGFMVGNGAIASGMSGSGSAIFATFEDRELAENIVGACKVEYPLARVFVTEPELDSKLSSI